MAELVLNYKAEIEAKDIGNHTHIYNAVKYSKKAMVQLLLKHQGEHKASNKDEQKTFQKVRASPTFFSWRQRLGGTTFADGVRGNLN